MKILTALFGFDGDGATGALGLADPRLCGA